MPLLIRTTAIKISLILRAGTAHMYATRLYRLITLILSLSITSFVLISCASSPTTSSTSAPKAKISTKKTTLSTADAQNYQQAKDHMVSGDFKNAQKRLLPLAKKHEGLYDIHANLALCFYKLNAIDNASKHADIAAKLDTKKAQVHNLRGLIAVEKKAFKSAETHYKQALQIDKNYALAHYNLAVLADIYFQDVNTAYSHYNKYLTLIDGQDQDVKDWVDQLKYSLEQ